MMGSGGGAYGSLYSRYKSGTYYDATSFNSGSSLSASTEYSTNVEVPQDGLMVVKINLYANQDVVSVAWAYDF